MTRWRHSFLLACLLWAGSVQAHTLDLSTARVTLRDQHIEVMVELDPFLLVQVGPTAIATESEPELLSHLQQARQLLDSETKLEVDGVRVGLALRGFPSAPEFRAMAATLSATQKEHGDLIRLRLEAPQAVPNAKTLALSLPTTLGPSVVSFVQPSTRYAAPVSLQFSPYCALQSYLQRGMYGGIGSGCGSAHSPSSLLWWLPFSSTDVFNMRKPNADTSRFDDAGSDLRCDGLFIP